MHREVSIWDIVLAGLLAVVVVLAAIGFVSHEVALDEYRRAINWQSEEHADAISEMRDRIDELTDTVNRHSEDLNKIVDFLNQ